MVSFVNKPICLPGCVVLSVFLPVVVVKLVFVVVVVIYAVLMLLQHFPNVLVRSYFILCLIT